ncbi:hypothetical protein NCPPB3778_31 [Rathayibacter phage NCPPB3778]|nr:hypothetical protein NCPPB3778_31 [Rathayibacter phage NCPPB3778]
MAIQTRKPTGVPSWPTLLLAGGEGSGKSYLSAQASASVHVGRTYWINFGEKAPDDLAGIPGADFDLVEHDNTVRGVRDIVREIAALPVEDKPTLLVVDSLTRVWDSIVESAQAAADKRSGRQGAAIGMDIWNKNKRTWHEIVDAINAHKGPAIVTARYDEVAEVDAGKPTGRFVWKIKSEKSLAYDVDAVLQMKVRGDYTLSKARSVKLALDKPRIYPDFSVQDLWEKMGVIGAPTAAAVYNTPASPDEAAVSEWGEALYAAEGDVKALHALGTDAASAGAPAEVLAAIREAYRKAKAGA